MASDSAWESLAILRGRIMLIVPKKGDALFLLSFGIGWLCFLPHAVTFDAMNIAKQYL